MKISNSLLVFLFIRFELVLLIYNILTDIYTCNILMRSYVREEGGQYRLVATGVCGVPFLGPLRQSLLTAETDCDIFRSQTGRLASIPDFHDFFDELRLSAESGRVKDARKSSATAASGSASNAGVVADLLRRLAAALKAECAISDLCDFRSEFEYMHETLAVAGDEDELIASVHFGRLQISVLQDALDELDSTRASAATSPAAWLAFQQGMAETRLLQQTTVSVLQTTAATIERRFCLSCFVLHLLVMQCTE